VSRRLKHRDLVRVLTLKDMTRSMTAPVFHIPVISTKVHDDDILTHQYTKYICWEKKVKTILILIKDLARSFS
jgi:hypothetical protein